MNAEIEEGACSHRFGIRHPMLFVVEPARQSAIVSQRDMHARDVAEMTGQYSLVEGSDRRVVANELCSLEYKGLRFDVDSEITMRRS